MTPQRKHTFDWNRAAQLRSQGYTYEEIARTLQTQPGSPHPETVRQAVQKVTQQTGVSIERPFGTLGQ